MKTDPRLQYLYTIVNSINLLSVKIFSLIGIMPLKWCVVIFFQNTFQPTCVGIGSSETPLCIQCKLFFSFFWGVKFIKK